MHQKIIQEMLEFILRAKQASYVGGGKALLPYRLGSHDLQYFEGDWAYHDSYLGENNFMGEEIIYYKGKAIWGMNYFGRILQPSEISSAQAGAIIRESLSIMYQEGRFLGGFTNRVDAYTYTDSNEGDPLYFTGKEWIETNDVLVYALDYHGGLIKE